jgi:hypothetical protein
VTLPTPDAQFPRLLSQRPHSNPLTHSIPSTPLPSASPAYLPGNYPPSPAQIGETTEASEIDAHQRVTDFAGNSWDLATGGLKTMTAKRQLPPRLERRTSEKAPGGTVGAEAQRSLTFALVLLACLIVMLVSGGIVLLVLLQP